MFPHCRLVSEARYYGSLGDAVSGGEKAPEECLCGMAGVRSPDDAELRSSPVVIDAQRGHVVPVLGGGGAEDADGDAPAGERVHLGG